MAKIRLLIAEDETVVRHALAQMLAAEEDILVVAEVADGNAAVALSRQQKPDVVLTDISMPRMDGIQAARQITEEMPACAVVILTVHDDDESVFEAIKAGAIGYVFKNAAPQQVLDAVRSAARGEASLDASLVSKVLAEFSRVTRRREAAKEVFAELTRREMEVLELLGEGRRNREIAAELFIAEKTVKNHVSSILMKLQVNDRTAAAVLATRHGLTDTR